MIPHITRIPRVPRIPAPPSALISSVAELETFLSSFDSSSTLYLDLEGDNLGRHGNISIITVLVQPQGLVKLIDVLALGKLSFTTPSSEGKTLQYMLENPKIPKCFWDVQNDADALWALYQVDLAGVVDIQLLENASRAGDKKYVCGLDKCVHFDLDLGFMDLNRWLRNKKDIKRLMSADVFSIRPLDVRTVQYCTDGVIHLPDLHHLYLRRIRADWLAKAKVESERRVREARSLGYEPQSSTKVLGPWGSSRSSLYTTDQILDQWEEEVIDSLQRELMGLDDFDVFDDM